MEDQRFKGQVAIVTGAGQGIGFEIAKEFALQGGSVILNDMDSQLAQKGSCRHKRSWW